MARENLPHIATTLTDGNLQALPPVDLGDRIMLIGTSEKGPVNEPVAIRDPQSAIDTFGDVTKGNLVQGFIEAFYAPGGEKDITLVRISNGATASLDLAETTAAGSTEDEETVDAVSELAIPALRIEALNPGVIYNNVSLRMETVDGQLSIIGYNPDTESETVIPYDSTGSVTGSVSNVKELADAINLDPNLGSIVEATANRIHTMFEVDIHEDFNYVNVSGSTVTIDLIDLLNDDAFDTDQAQQSYVGYPTPRVVALNGDHNATIATITVTGDISTWPTAGYVKIYKENVQGEQSEVEIVKYSSLLGQVLTVDADALGDGSAILGRGFAGTSSGTQGEGVAHDDTDIVEYYIPVFPTPVSVTAADGLDELLEVYELNNLTEELDAAGKSDVELTYPIQMGTSLSLELLDIDGSVDLDGNGEAQHLIRNAFIGSGDGVETNFQFTAYEAIYDDDLTPAPSGVYDPTDPESYSTLKVYRTSSAGVTVEVAKTDYTVELVGGSPDYIAEIEFTNPPQDGSIITVSYDSVPFDMVQVASLAAIQSSNSYKDYFAAGNMISFGTAQPADLRIIYPAKITYKIGQEVIISGDKNDQIVITPSSRTMATDNLQNGPVVIGLDYYYQPEWIDLASAQSLQGGTDGINMTNSEKYRVLTEAYTALADVSADVVVPLRTYLDDTKIVYDRETGLPVEVNAGFAQQLNTYLEGLLEGVNESFGIISVKPADSARLVDVNSWYEKLVTPSASDLTRAANIMQALDAKLLDVAAMELVVTDPIVGSPYITTGEAVLAGLTAKLLPQSATTNKFLGNKVVGLRYGLSSRQLNGLTGARYITARLRTGVGVVVTDGVTAAATTSDWVRRSTYRITAASMDVVRTIAEPFLGEGFTPEKKAALETGITRGLLQMQEDGALQTFSFSIEQTPAEAVAGQARVSLVLQPAFELRKIRVTVKLSAVAV